MKSKKSKWLLMMVFPILVSGCVSLATFNEHVADYKAALDQSRSVEAVLLCESRNDAYQDMLGSDEPNPTRRDEPNPTRRDQACQDEFKDITNDNVQVCKVDMLKCVAPLAEGGANLGTPQCRGCYSTCLTTGTWPNLACTLP